MEFERTIEQREHPDFKLTIVVHRHGPREGDALSEEGKDITRQYFEDAYEGVPLGLPDGQGVDVVHSPIKRTTETAEIAIGANRSTINSMTTDERLAERGVALKHLRAPFRKKHRLDRWMELDQSPERFRDDIRGNVERLIDRKIIKLREKSTGKLASGQEMAKKFADWLLEKINHKKIDGGTQEIDAYTHFPVMISFLYSLGKKLNVEFLPEGWKDRKDIKYIVDYLNYINFYVDSKQPDTIRVNFKGTSVDVPLEVIKEIAGV